MRKLDVPEHNPMRFVIDGYARTGTTALAEIISTCGDVSCLIEPFHPARYGGQYYRSVTSVASLRSILNLLWLRWNGIKHVWIAQGGFPFNMNPEFNDELAIASSSLIWIQRRNCLQRYVSAIISRRLRYWIGPKEEYLQRLDARGFPPLCPDDARESIRLDVEAVRNREGLLIARGVRFITVYYEDIFDDSVTGNEQLKQVNRVLTFLGRNSAPVSITQSEAWLGVMNQDRCKWNSQSVYKRIPGISQFERLTGSDETGWLFNKG